LMGLLIIILRFRHFAALPKMLESSLGPVPREGSNHKSVVPCITLPRLASTHRMWGHDVQH
jgi:hypothetical protein